MSGILEFKKLPFKHIYIEALDLDFFVNYTISSRLNDTQIKIQSYWNCNKSHFLNFNILKNWFHVKSVCQKNHHFSTLVLHKTVNLRIP